MPTVRKLEPSEVQTIENKGKGLRKLTEEQYDAFLRDYAVGDYGEAELEEDEKRLTVRNRLKAAATRRGIDIEFKRTQGNIIRFRVGEASPDGNVGRNKSTELAKAYRAIPEPEPEPEPPPKRKGGRPKKNPA
jgi:hypothetical protein